MGPFFTKKKKIFWDLQRPKCWQAPSQRMVSCPYCRFIQCYTAWGSHIPFTIDSNKQYFNKLWSLSAPLTVIITSTCTCALQLGTNPVTFSLYPPIFFPPQLLYKYIQKGEGIEKHLVCGSVS